MAAKRLYVLEVGGIYDSVSSGEFKVLSLPDSKMVEINFVATDTRKIVQRSHASRGLVKDPYHRSVYGIGYIGERVKRGNKTILDKRIRKLWDNMFCRVNRKKSYAGCSIDPRWHNFATFAEDVKQLENYDNWLNEPGYYHLDKDFIKDGNKIYSPDLCLFAPAALNASYRHA